MTWGPMWSWLHTSWIYNYLCNQCISPPTLLVRIPFRRCVLDTTLCDKICQWLATGRFFSPDPPVSSTKKTNPLYSWNVAESGVKHYNPNHNPIMTSIVATYSEHLRCILMILSFHLRPSYIGILPGPFLSDGEYSDYIHLYCCHR
jgi:hypothetical protein